MKFYVLVDREPVATDDPDLFGIGLDIDRRRVAYTEIGDVHVSTVFLGFDHGFGDGPPLLFETMIFGGEYKHWQERYATWTAAQAGHDRFVTAVRNGTPPDGAA